MPCRCQAALQEIGLKAILGALTGEIYDYHDFIFVRARWESSPMISYLPSYVKITFLKTASNNGPQTLTMQSASDCCDFCSVPELHSETQLYHILYRLEQ